MIYLNKVGSAVLEYTKEFEKIVEVKNPFVAE